MGLFSVGAARGIGRKMPIRSDHVEAEISPSDFSCVRRSFFADGSAFMKDASESNNRQAGNFSSSFFVSIVYEAFLFEFSELHQLIVRGGFSIPLSMASASATRIASVGTL